MELGIGLLAGVLAVVAAVRSTWSPCGLSMLSTVTPVAERARGHRFWVTASWFVIGATLGGATLGFGAALLALIPMSSGAATALAGVVVAIALASDLGLFGFRLPGHTRQVNEDWLADFRPWVYGLGFGWQIGVGLATYIMTAAVYAMFVLAALTGEPLVAFALMTLFGFVRGLAVFLGARLTDPARVFAFHRRFDAIGAYARWLVLGVEGAVFIALVGIVAIPVLVAGAALAAAARRMRSARLQPSVHLG